MKGSDFTISRDVPSVCANKLINGEVDLGLIPVAMIPQVPNATIISDYCIGSIGKVNTVLLMSKVPLESIKKVYLDTESRTSVNLVKVLARKYWRTNWEYDNLPIDYATNKSIESMVLIGDKTQESLNFPYKYDLSEAWFNMTGKAFVFAAWVANKNLPQDFINRFNEALKQGLDRIPESIKKYNNGIKYNLEEYLNNYISYPFNKEKKEALKLFLSFIAIK
jgi:chorismate dehydratase